MSDLHFEVVFRGDIEPGRAVVEVKESLGKLFNAETSRVEQLFSGKPVVIKAGLEKEKALHYQAILKKIGALVDIRPDMSVEVVASAETDGSSDYSELIAAALNSPQSDNYQSDSTQSINAQESSSAKIVVKPEVLENFNFDVAPVGVNVLPKEYQKNYTPRDIDTSHLTVSEAGSDVLEEKDKRSYQEKTIDTSHLSVDKMR